MSKALLLVNAGSSSLKLSVCELAANSELASASADWSREPATLKIAWGARNESRAVDFREPVAAFKGIAGELLRGIAPAVEIAAVGHRVVHGGERSAAAVIDGELLRSLAELTELAPLHNPPGLEVIGAARERFPAIPHVAVFDTAFHRTIRPEAAQYAVPQVWTADWKIRRYGFHGLSHSYCSRRAAELLDRASEGFRVIVCHLGHGCSASAVADGKCVDTTMGFTPLEGLMMSSRSGNIDAGAVLHVIERYKLSPHEVSEVLNKQSGLRGVSGVSADLREVLAAEEKGHAASRLAVRIFVYRIQQAIAGLTVPLGGLDALVFTAGIGENSPRIRSMICAELGFLGIGINSKLNDSEHSDCDISSPDSKVKVLVIRTREDLTLLRETRALLPEI